MANLFLLFPEAIPVKNCFAFVCINLSLLAAASSVAVAQSEPAPFRFRFQCQGEQAPKSSEISSLEYQVSFSAGFFSDSDREETMNGVLKINGELSPPLNAYVSGGATSAVVLVLSKSQIGYKTIQLPISNACFSGERAEFSTALVLNQEKLAAFSCTCREEN